MEWYSVGRTEFRCRVRDAVGNREAHRGPVENVVLAQLCMHRVGLQAMSGDR